MSSDAWLGPAACCPARCPQLRTGWSPRSPGDTAMIRRCRGRMVGPDLAATRDRTQGRAAKGSATSRVATSSLAHKRMSRWLMHPLLLTRLLLALKHYRLSLYWTPVPH